MKRRFAGLALAAVAVFGLTGCHLPYGLYYAGTCSGTTAPHHGAYGDRCGHVAAA